MTTEELYLEHKGLIKRCADRLVRQFHCPQLLDDLTSAGTVTFLERLDDYDKIRDASLATYLYPFIVGTQKREIEKNLTAFGLSKREFQAVCKDGFLSSAVGTSLDVRFGEDDDRLASYLPSTETPVHRQVHLKICMEHLRKAFENELSYKEREILGGFYGVFGHSRKTLAEIGEVFNMKENAALKAKDKALEKLSRLCLNGEFGVWHWVFRAGIEMTRPGMLIAFPQ